MAAKPKQRFILTHKRAPGDTLVMTALIRDIAKAYPNRFEIDVDTSAMDLWRHNPHLTPLRRPGKKAMGVKWLKMEYGRGIKDQNYECVHFMPYFHRDFERQTGFHVPVSLPYPDLHLSPEEKNVRPVQGRYWVMLSGGKSDFTAKVWHKDKFQEVANNLSAMGLGVVQLGGSDAGHWHPEIAGTLDLVGQTNLRDMIRVIHHADGVICGVTCAMHMAAALQRPCVVLAGGREAWWWEAYVRENRGLVCPEKLKIPHRYLHTIGLLDCCKRHGCWKNKVVPLRDDKSLCYHPVVRPGQPVPLCMDMIRVDHVMEAVMEYYEDQSLPPINVDAKTGIPAPTAPATPAKDKKGALLSLFDDPPPKQPVTEKPPASTHHLKASIPAAALGVRPGQQIKLATNANLETRGKTRPVARAPGQGQGIGAELTTDIFDHVDIGGKFTICALFYGQEKFFDLHQRCLNSIISTVPQDRMDLRVASNALNARSLQLIEQHVQSGVITKHYRHDQNIYKYPAMREMFFDAACPIKTKWVLWFDDDSIADRTPAWLKLLAQHIIQFHRRNNAHMFGAPFVWTLQAGQREWFERRPWFKGKQWRLHNGKPSPSGNKIQFCTGGFWAISHEAIVKCNIPDPEIGHNGGDVCIGEQLYQGGFNMKSWNGKKQFIYTSSVPRRGETLPMPGTRGHEEIPRLVRVQ